MKVYQAYNLPKCNREYRQKFSKAYKTMFSQHGGYEELCYMKEILDSAQENYPHLWVNGEKYVFSEDVIEAGDKLFETFNKLNEKVNEFVGLLTTNE